MEYYRNGLVEGIRNKIILISVFLFLGMIMAAGFSQYMGYKGEMSLLYKESYAEQQVVVKKMISTVLSLINAVRDLSSGTFPVTERREVLKEIKNLNLFDNDESFFIASYDGTILFDNNLINSGNPFRYTVSELYGDDVFSEIKDVVETRQSTGISCIRKKSLSGGCSFPDLLYVGNVPDWKWIIGGEAGKEKISKAVSSLEKKNIRRFIIFGEFYLFFAVMFFTAVFAGFRKILSYAERDMAFFVHSFDSALNTNTLIKLSSLKYREFRLIAEKVNGIIMKKKRSDEKATSSELKYKRLFSNMQDSIVITDSDCMIIDVNQPALSTQFGYDFSDIIGKHFSILFKDMDEYKLFSKNVFKENPGGSFYITEYKKKNGQIFIAEVLSFKYKSTGTEAEQVVYVNRDITQRRRNEKELENLLEEKQILLREIHHRVKNNMAVIIAFLSLQSMKVEDLKTREILEAVENRIRTMVLVHEFLHQDANLKEVNVKEFIDALALGLLQLYGGEIKLLLDVAGVKFGIDILVPLGLLINEILTNSFKHAFSDNSVSDPYISVSLAEMENNSLLLTIKDNGRGFYPSDTAGNPAIGLEVIDALVHQIGGDIRVSNKDGTEYMIRFKVP